MSKKSLCLLLLCLISVLPAFSQIANQRSLRFQGQLVELGDSKFEVLSRFGEPDGKLRQEREFYRKVTSDLVESSYLSVEHWLFNFGPRRFYYVLTFEDQRLTCITEGDYGYAFSDDRNCHPVSWRVAEGDIIPVVLMKCGEPSYEEVSYRERYVARNNREGEKINIKTQEWTYNFGPTQPIGVLTFENGVLVSIKQGKRGF